jgi:hypothetical protein
MPAGTAQPGQLSDLQGLGSRLRRTLPPLPQGEKPGAPADAAKTGATPSLASLMKQFRA